MEKAKLLEAIDRWDTKTIFGKCHFCGKPLPAISYCFGCKDFVCHKCDDFLSHRIKIPVMGKHKVEEHKQGGV